MQNTRTKNSYKSIFEKKGEEEKRKEEKENMKEGGREDKRLELALPKRRHVNGV